MIIGSMQKSLKLFVCELFLILCLDFSHEMRLKCLSERLELVNRKMTRRTRVNNNNNSNSQQDRSSISKIRFESQIDQSQRKAARDSGPMPMYSSPSQVMLARRASIRSPLWVLIFISLLTSIVAASRSSNGPDKSSADNSTGEQRNQTHART